MSQVTCNRSHDTVQPSQAQRQHQRYQCFHVFNFKYQSLLALGSTSDSSGPVSSTPLPAQVYMLHDRFEIEGAACFIFLPAILQSL
jgi:hypothetical protein